MLNLFYGLQFGRRKFSLLRNIAAAIFILSLLYTTTKSENAQSYTKEVINKIYGDEQANAKAAAAAANGNPDLFTTQTVDLSHLSKHDLSPDFYYSRRVINTRYVQAERKSLTNLDDSLFKQMRKLPNKHLKAVSSREDSPLTLDVSIAKSTADADTLSFAMATPIERLLDSLPGIMHWLSNTGAMLHVIAPVDPRKEEVTRHIRNLGINITIIDSNDRFPINYFSLLPLLYHTRTARTRWLAMIDDDTFFPDLGYLLSHLEHRYNHKLPQIITGVSDDVVQVRKHGMMPFGGGGIFLSVPFAAMIVDNNYPGTAGAIKGGEYPTPPWPEYSPFGPAEGATEANNWAMDPKSPYRHSIAFQNCLKTERFEGDQIFNDCINKETPIRPQYDIQFHQMDLHGDISGFFESGRRSLTLHHWKTWFKVDIPSGVAVTKICGKDCYLQRFRFRGLEASPAKNHPDETWVLNNGYSITRYPNGIKGLAENPPNPQTIQGALRDDISSPPPPPYLPDPHKNPIAANPRFMRMNGEWIEWPNLWLGEEVRYEGVLGFIVDKDMNTGGYALPNKQADPYKGYGNLLWVPAAEPFVAGTAHAGEAQATIPAQGEELKKMDDASSTGNEKIEPKSPETEAKAQAKPEDKKEALNKDAHASDRSEAAPNEAPKAEGETITHKIAVEETSHFHKFNKRDDAPAADWVPLAGALSSAGVASGSTDHLPSKPGRPNTIPDATTTPVIESEPTSNITLPNTSPEDVLRSDEDIEDERRFWSGIEKSWGGDIDRFEHALGPLRRPLKKGQEVIRYMMVEAVGGWGDPNGQKIEHVKEAVQPDKYIIGYEGDPAKKQAKIEHGGYLIWHGDPGFEGLWGPDPESPARKEKRAAEAESDLVGADSSVKEEEEEEERDASARAEPAPVQDVVGGGSVIAARAQPADNHNDGKSKSRKRGLFGNGPEKLEGGGLGGVDRPPVDWVRQTYVRRRWHPPANPIWPDTDQSVDGEWEKTEDEVIELIWMR